MKCKYCGSENISKYEDTFPASGNDQDEFARLEEVSLFDCLDCGELAQEVETDGLIITDEEIEAYATVDIWTDEMELAAIEFEHLPEEMQAEGLCSCEIFQSCDKCKS